MRESAGGRWLCSVDGVLARSTDAPLRASVPVLDRGLLLGDGVFETMRTYGGRVFALGAHLERLDASCRAVGMRPCCAGGLAAEVEALLAEAGRWAEVRGCAGAEAWGESYVRVTLTRGDMTRGLRFDPDAPPRRTVLVKPLPKVDASLYESGVSVRTVARTWALHGSPAWAAKACAYLPNVLALAEAQRAGAQDALSVGPGGEVLEATASNVFIVRDGQLRTPAVALGVLPGITRHHVLRLAGEAQIPAKEALLYPPDLYRAEEIFLTSSIREVVPVVAVDGGPVGSGRPGPVTRALHDRFRRYARSRRDARSRQ